MLFWNNSLTDQPISSLGSFAQFDIEIMKSQEQHPNESCVGASVSKHEGKHTHKTVSGLLWRKLV